MTAFWTDAVYVILGRFNSMQPEPVARAYRIGGGTWREEPLEVV